jgi:Na+/H+ antiporter NhaC
VQGLLPYGAQLLMAAGLASISPVEITPYLYYPFIMGACALIAILLQRPKCND